MVPRRPKLSHAALQHHLIPLFPQKVNRDLFRQPSERANKEKESAKKVNFHFLEKEKKTIKARKSRFDSRRIKITNAASYTE